jgi:hypothetical protein
MNGLCLPACLLQGTKLQNTLLSTITYLHVRSSRCIILYRQVIIATELLVAMLTSYLATLATINIILSPSECFISLLASQPTNQIIALFPKHSVYLPHKA